MSAFSNQPSAFSRQGSGSPAISESKFLSSLLSARLKADR
jgi:hypothetical protein